MGRTNIVSEANKVAFQKAMSQEKYKNINMPQGKETYIKWVSQWVLARMVEADINYYDKITQYRYIKIVMDTSLENIKKEEYDEVFDITNETLNNMITFLLENGKNKSAEHVHEASKIK